MRYRVSFMAGVAVGFVLGTKAGRERYEQIKGLARKAADNPSVQQAAAAAQAQASELARTARERVSERVPKIGDKLPGSRQSSASGATPDGQPVVGAPDLPQP